MSQKARAGSRAGSKPGQGSAPAPAGGAKARKAAKPAAAPSEASPAAPPLAQPGQDWTARVLALLLNQPLGAGGPDALLSLWADHATGQGTVDGNRLAILTALGRRLAQLAANPPPIDRAPLPDWPDAEGANLPDLHPTGLPGTSLVALCLPGDEAALLESLPSWLASRAEEVLVLELSDSPVLARALLAGPRPDPRLRLAEAPATGLTAAEGWNAACRMARHQRLICLCPGVLLPEGHAWRVAHKAGQFRILPGPDNGRGFLLDLDRRDLALVGGFNEYLPSSDFAPDELAARLVAAGLAALPPNPSEGVVLPAPPPHPPLGEASLREAFVHHPALAALRNRHLAALMPDWLGKGLRRFACTGPAALGPRLAPLGPPYLTVPATVASAAETRAMADLLAAHIGGAPVLLSPRRQDMVLSRPARDVTAVDIAVAASHVPDPVRSRGTWLVLDVSPDLPPLLADGTAVPAFEWLMSRAEALDLSPVLCLDIDTSLEPAELFEGLPQVAPDPAMLRDLWPASLADLARDRPLRHARLQLDAAFLADHARLAGEGPVILRRKPKLFIDAQHGLGNRLRAMASAAAIAEATGRELVVIWQPDAHCGCAYEDLFHRQGGVLSEGFAAEAPSFGIDLFNYMEVEPGSAKDAPILLHGLRDAYLRSAYPLVHPASTWETENRALARFVPNEVVMDLVQRGGPAPALSVHVRMEGGRAAEHLAYESPANWTAEAHRDIDHWRRRSHYSYFLARIDQLVAQGLADSIFLATDTPEVQERLSQIYGDRLTTHPRPASDRSVVAMVHALADALLLSRAPRIVGSTWSSFTELAARLARHPITVELSGRDF